MSKEPERSIGRHPSSILKDNGGTPNELDEVIGKLRSGQRFSWNNVGWDTIRSVVLLAAAGIQQPASMLSEPDFRRPVEDLNRHNLTSLIHFSRVHPEREGENRIPFLLKRAGIEVTPEDIIERIKSSRKIYADRVTEDAMNGALRQVLPMMAEELKRPVSLLGVWDFTQKPLAGLNGRTASGLYQHLRLDPDRKGQNVVNYILERAGIKITAEDVVTYIKTRRNNENEERRMYWGRIPGEECGRLLKMVAEELGLPTSMLKTEHLRRPLELLGGKTLGGLFEHHYLYRDRQEQDTVTSVLERAGIQITSDDVIECIKSGHQVYWRRVPWEIIGEVLQKVADEVGVPLPFMDERYLTHPLALFKGHTLGGIRHLMTREGAGGMSSLTEKVGRSITAEDVIERMQANRQIVWKRVPWEEVGKLIEIAADETGIPISMLGRIDYTRSLEAFNDHSLSGLYQYASRQANRQRKDPSVFILEQTGFDVSSADVIGQIREGRQVFWSKIPWEVITQLLNQVASEIGISVKNIGSPELTQPLPFLNGRSLIGFYGFCWTHPERNGKDIITFLYEKTGITQTAEDVINQIKMERPVFWYRVPEDEIKRIIQMTADDLGVPASMLAEGDVTRTPLSFLDGRKLGGLYGYMRRQLIGNDMGTRVETTEYLLQRLGFPATENDVIQNISQDRRVMWNRIPWEVIKMILHQAAEEADLPDYMISHAQLVGQRFNFLNQHTLGGFYSYCLAHPEKSMYETGLDFLRRKTGLPAIPRTLTRANFRLQRMEEDFTRYVPDSSDYFDIGGFMPWVEAVSQTYQNSILDIARDEIQSEVVILLSEELQDGDISPSNFVKRVHERLEQYLRKTSSSWYKERSLTAPIRENLTLEDVIGYEDFNLEQVDEAGISEMMEESLGKLSPIQRRLILGITLEDKTFEEMEDELGLDIDTLQEHYDDALTLLKESFEED